MLLAALHRESDTAFVDLLTPADLEVLRSKESRDSARLALPPNKRYLILTVAGEFERVHYPLPLALNNSTDPAQLKAIIARLRLQLAERPVSDSHASQVRPLSSALDCLTVKCAFASLCQ